MKTSIPVDIKIPMVPNFLMLHKEYNDSQNIAVDIGEFTDEQLRNVGEIWTAQLVANATKRRVQRKGD